MSMALHITIIIYDIVYCKNFLPLCTNRTLFQAIYWDFVVLTKNIRLSQHVLLSTQNTYGVFASSRLYHYYF